MIVVGGTYVEDVVDPSSSILAGSGLRAAASIAAQGRAVTLVTAIDEHNGPALEAVAGGVGVTLDVRSREQPVAFVYRTPVSAPRLYGADQDIGVLDASDDAVLAYAMVEARLGQIDAGYLIIDPQGLQRGQGDVSSGGLKARARALIANNGEATALSGHHSAAHAAQALLDLGVDVTVVKAGARGAWLATTSLAKPTWIPPCPTAKVWPIGSGDAFTAGFADAWSHGAEPVEAARAGSTWAARWCATKQLAPARGSDYMPASQLPLDAACVYLAGPLFDTAQRWLLDEIRSGLLDVGVNVFSPWHDVGFGGASADIAQRDLAGLAASSAVLAIADGLDAGTMFECGWAARAAIPVIALAERAPKEELTMLSGPWATVHTDLATAVYHAAWAALGWQ